MAGNYGAPCIQGGGDNAELWTDESRDYIGGGTYGKVWRTFHPLYTTVAVKVFELKGPHRTAIEEFKKEIDLLWSTNDCPYIVRCHGWFGCYDLAGVVMEFMENGTLFELLHGNRRVELSLQLKIRLVQNISMAMDYLHNVSKSQNIIHGDIKTLNILLDRYLVAKLADFGGASLQTVSWQASCTNRNLKHGERNVWTVNYADPEALRHPEKQLNSSNDMFSFGAVIREIYTGHIPYHDCANFRNQESLERDIKFERVRLEAPIPKSNMNRYLTRLETTMCGLIRLCLGSDFSRPKARDVKNYVLQNMKINLDEVDNEVVTVRQIIGRSWPEHIDNRNLTNLVTAVRHFQQGTTGNDHGQPHQRYEYVYDNDEVPHQPQLDRRQNAVTRPQHDFRNLSVHDWLRFGRSLLNARFSRKGNSNNRARRDSDRAGPSNESELISEARALPRTPRKKNFRILKSTSNKPNLTCFLYGDDGVGKHWMVLYQLYNDVHKGLTQKRYKEVREVGGQRCNLKYVFTPEAKYVDVILYCFSIEDFRGYQNLSECWSVEVERKYGGARIPTLVVGLQSDLRSHVNKEVMPVVLGNDIASAIGADSYMECSGRTGYNVHEVFRKAFEMALNNMSQRH